MSQISDSPGSFSTWLDVVRHQARRKPDEPAYTFLPDGQEARDTLTFRQLEIRARAVAATLQASDMFGRRALLLYPSGLDYIVAFIGCLYAGAIAVPVSAPHGGSKTKPKSIRLRTIATDAQPSVILTLSQMIASGEALLSEIPGASGHRWVATDLINDTVADEWVGPSVTPETLAFLQYTSGSTATPKGVAVSHRNLLCNEAIIREAFEHTEKSVVVGWLPLFHDMGLIGNVLQPLYCGSRCILMPPAVFLQDPLRWLLAISHYRGTTSGGPNFAYDLCVQRIAPADRARLDLSCWDVAFNGSEPVRAETIERFVETFGPSGFRRETFYPCYGLAEATLIVSGGTKSHAPVIGAFPCDTGNVRSLIGCGRSLPGQKAIIVHPESLKECLPGQTGEIWVSGESVAGGYWGREVESRSVFQARTADDRGPFLRTGDLGFFAEGELFIAGRLKDLVIIRGRNHYPQDIELTVSKAHPALRAGAGAAFSVDGDGAEQLIIVQEVDRQHRNINWEPVIRSIRDAVVEHHEISPHSVVLLRPGTIPKTSSGKIQRHACRAAFVQQSLKILHSDVIPGPLGGSGTSNPNGAGTGASNIQNRDDLLLYLRRQVAQLMRIDPDRLDPDHSPGSMGLDSLKAIELSSRIETDFGILLPMATLLEAPGLAAVALTLEQELAHGRRVEAPGETAGAGKASIPGGPRQASPQQEVLWLLHESNRASSLAYTILVAVRLRGALATAALEQSLAEILRRHEILRTTYAISAGRLVQEVGPVPTPVLRLENLRGLPPAERETAAFRGAVGAARQPIDLARGPIIGMVLFQISGTEYILTLTIPHIACDGWSVQLFLEELASSYPSFLAGQYPRLPEIPVQYADFNQRHGKDPSSDTERKELDYWRQQLQGPWPRLILPTDRPRDDEHGFESGREQFLISGLTWEAVKAFCRNEGGVTPFMFLLAVLKATLAGCSGQRDLIIGSSVANRNRAGAQRLIGPFTNAVALRTRLDADPEFREILNRVQQTALEAYAHQNAPFDVVLRELNLVPRGSRRSPLEVVFLFQGFLTTAWHMGGITAELEEFDNGLSNFDLAFLIHEKSGELSASLRYRTALFDPKTIRELAGTYNAVLEQALRKPETRVSQIDFAPSLKARAEAARIREEPQIIAIASTFTAGLIENSLAFWMEELDIPARILFAPYNQVFQQLLDEQSLLARNSYGVNVILLRVADWERYTDLAGGDDSFEARLEKNAGELIEAMAASARRSRVPNVVCVCPSNAADRTRELAYQRMEEWLKNQLEELKGICVLTTAGLQRLYPVSVVFDPHADKAGHVPFQPEFFTALGTVIARMIHTLSMAPYKAVVLDCDQTLWNGVVGEDGARGVKLDSCRKALQEFMVARHDAGMLVLLCSKNHEPDVLEVFERRTDFPLRLEHIATRKINWNSKSANLVALSNELGLPLESFIFLDDNPVECAEVRAACPAVMTLQLPERVGEIPSFLNHAWVFDQLKITDEDRQRTRFYRQEVEREQFRRTGPKWVDFLDGLKLECDIREMQPEEFNRVVQLAGRTNQFNLNPTCRSEADIERLRQSEGFACFVVRAKDRFGDYGLVGMMLAGERDDTVQLDAFMLSCRALGRGIEHQMVSFLGRRGVSRGLKYLKFHFVPTARNQPARDFLERITAPFRGQTPAEFEYLLPMRDAVAMDVRRFAMASAVPMEETKQPAHRHHRTGWELVMRIAGKLRDVAAIEEAMKARIQSRIRKSGHIEAPRTPVEKMLAAIWCDVLRLDRVGIHDNFFELGGHSLLGTVLISRIRRDFDLELQIQTILETPTVAELAEIIQGKLIRQSNAEEMALALAELDRMSDQEVTALLADETDSQVPRAGEA